MVSRKHLFLCLTVAVGCAYLMGCQVFRATTRPARVHSAWVQLGANDSLLVRAIVEGQSCPTVSFTAEGVDHTETLEVRAPATEGFAVQSCEATLPLFTTRAFLDGTPLAVPGLKPPEKILIIGDTGCRIYNAYIQDCNDPDAWPFQKLAELSAGLKPDLVIHVGDYLYRSTPCPQGDARCQGSSSGDIWPTWDQDFFTPARALLAAAPWLPIRGNHEQCPHAYQGWFRFLDVWKYQGPTACSEFVESYQVKVGDWSFLAFDSTNASESSPPPAEQVDAYAERLRQLQPTTGRGNILLTHKPFWANTDNAPNILTTTLQQALRKTSLAERLSLVISGHTHFSSTIIFGEEDPAQVIVGNSGSALYDVPSDFSGVVIDGKTVRYGRGVTQFGFVLLQRTAADGWTLTQYAVDGTVQSTCVLTTQTGLTCDSGNAAPPSGATPGLQPAAPSLDTDGAAPAAGATSQ